jgi:type I restriction enzyme M protein
MSELDESAEICLDEDGNPEPDTELRDYENVRVPPPFVFWKKKEGNRIWKQCGSAPTTVGCN